MEIEAETPDAPLTERFSIEAHIVGIGADLNALRAGKISVDDARVRAELAKQFLNGVRMVVNAQKFLAQNARLVGQSDATRAAPGDIEAER